MAPEHTKNILTIPSITIEAGHTERYYWKDLWRYRELFYFLAWRDILVRYKQTVIGIAWALIRPLLTMVVFTVVFGKLAKLPSDVGAPYPIMVFAAMLPWQFFATAFAEAGNSLIINSSMISKVYFPRLVMPTSAVLVSFVDFLISFMLLIGLMVWFCSRFAHCPFAAVHSDCLCGLPRYRFVDCGTECQIPGLPIHYSFYCTNGALHFTGGFQ